MRHETYSSLSDEIKTQKMKTQESKEIKFEGKVRERVRFIIDIVVLAPKPAGKS